MSEYEDFLEHAKAFPSVEDKLRSENKRLTEEVERLKVWGGMLVRDLESYEAALRDIRENGGARDFDAAARADDALGEEAPLPRSFLDDPKIQAQIAEAKERARKGGEKA